MGLSSSDVTAGTRATAAQYNNLRADVAAGKFYDNSGAGTNYAKIIHDGTNGILNVNGTDVAQMTTALITALKALKVTDGSVGTPGIHFTGDVDTGLGLISSKLALIFGGAVRADNNGTTWDFQGQALTTTSTIAANSGLKPKTSGTGSDAITHYEQSGSFTPALAYDTPAASAFTYNTQVGRFTRSGNVVHFNLRIILSAYGLGGASGSLNITGLPYTSANVSGSHFTFPVFYSNVDIPTGGLSAVGRMINNTTSIQIFSNLATGANLVWDPASLPFALSASSVIQLAGHYLV